MYAGYYISMRNKEKLAISLLILLVLSFLTITVLKSLSDYTLETIKVAGTTLHVEVADEPSELRKGLMYRESLDEDRGMLFIFENVNYHTFWMKNTRIPLDMLWIGEDWKIVDIKENVPPCDTPTCPNYLPASLARYVLEVNAGWVKKNGISIGDYVEYSPRKY